MVLLLKREKKEQNYNKKNGSPTIVTTTTMSVDEDLQDWKQSPDYVTKIGVDNFFFLLVGLLWHRFQSPFPDED